LFVLLNKKNSKRNKIKKGKKRIEDSIFFSPPLFSHFHKGAQTKTKRRNKQRISTPFALNPVFVLLFQSQKISKHKKMKDSVMLTTL